MRWLLLIALGAACGTADMLAGLPCATDGDCLGYFCTAGQCEPPPTSCPHGPSTYCGGQGVPGMSTALYLCDHDCDANGDCFVHFRLQEACDPACGGSPTPDGGCGTP